MLDFTTKPLARAQIFSHRYTNNFTYLQIFYLYYSLHLDRHGDVSMCYVCVHVIFK
jgi:hypothetical protein